MLLLVVQMVDPYLDQVDTVKEYKNITYNLPFAVRCNIETNFHHHI